MRIGPIAGIVLLAASCGHLPQTYVNQNRSLNVNAEATANKSVNVNAEPTANKSVNASTQSSAAKAKLQDPRFLCNRIPEIKILPLKGDRGVDRVFDAFLDAGDAVVPCLIAKVTDSTKIRDPREAPGYAGIQVRTGDIAFLILLYMKEFTADKFLPDDVRKDYNDEGIYAYFKYVQQPSNRKKLQDNLNAWYRTQDRNSPRP